MTLFAPLYRRCAASLLVIAFAAASCLAEGSHDHGRTRADAAGVEASVATAPDPPEAGKEALFTVTLRDSKGNPPEGVEVGHERLAHFLLVSENLEEFHHLHAEDFGALPSTLLKSGAYGFRTTPGRGGGYRLGVDLTLRGEPVLLLLPLEVSGEAQEPTKWNFGGERGSGGLRFELTTSPAAPRAGDRVEFTLEVTEGGRPAAGLRPYLGAAAHVAVFSGRAATLAHLHGESRGSGGGHGAHGGAVSSPLVFSHVFPSPGNHRLWVQVNGAGGVVTVPFDVRVE